MKEIVFLLIALTLPIFCWAQNSDDCLSEAQPNAVTSAEQLAKEVTKDINANSSFKATLEFNEKYSACPKHEPGTDQYFVFSKAQATNQGEQIAIEYQLLGRLQSNDGKKYSLVREKKSVTSKFMIFKTEKGFRYGDEKSHLTLQKGIYLTKEAAASRFNLKL